MNHWNFPSNSIYFSTQSQLNRSPLVAISPLVLGILMHSWLQSACPRSHRLFGIADPGCTEPNTPTAALWWCQWDPSSLQPLSEWNYLPSLHPMPHSRSNLCCSSSTSDEWTPSAHSARLGEGRTVRSSRYLSANSLASIWYPESQSSWNEYYASCYHSSVNKRDQLPSP